MKQFLLTTVIAFFTISAFAQPKTEVESVYLDNISQLNLAIDDSAIAVLVNYPGMNISGICAIEIVADSFRRGLAIQRLVDQLDFKSIFGEHQRRVKIINDTVGRLTLTRGSYVDGVSISTKNGITLKEAIEQTLGQDRTVILRPSSC